MRCYFWQVTRGTLTTANNNGNCRPVRPLSITRVTAIRPHRLPPDIDREYTPHVLHHAAAFAVTRWSNLYSPGYAGLFGDFIGGPLRKALALGILDIPVCSGSWGRFTPLTHYDYWNKDRSIGQAIHGAGLSDALEALQHALGLNRLREYHLGTDNRPVGTKQSDAESTHLEEEAPKSLLPSG